VAHARDGRRSRPSGWDWIAAGVRQVLVGGLTPAAIQPQPRACGATERSPCVDLRFFRSVKSVKSVVS
jgi:hypothetical protein